MEKKKRFLVIDAGNTRVKIGVYVQDELVDDLSFSNEELPRLKSFLTGNRFDASIISSVRSQKDTKWLLQLVQGAKLFQALDKIPLQISYETPETLGADRLANAIGAYSISKKTCLIVDIGTCVKFDIVDDSGTYLGGSISPGLNMRYRAMHEFTAGLPLVNNFKPAKLIGKSTVDCMHIGVMRGMQAELDSFIKTYTSEYQDLDIFITGGDAHYFDFDTKNNIFVNENITIYGLFITLQAHAN
ncbi:MAG: type III pantothenate kinase [Crocinitomicaceae bacterium]|nr:type III pantothenate kinase [Crocinitomicaceae bacterium]